MIRNFAISDGVIFLAADKFDLRGNYRLSSIVRFLHPQSSVEMLWDQENSNRRLRFTFVGVDRFEVKNGDADYPQESETSLGIAGFCTADLDPENAELFVEPSFELDYLAFVMDDRSTYLVRAKEGRLILE